MQYLRLDDLWLEQILFLWGLWLLLLVQVILVVLFCGHLLEINLIGLLLFLWTEQGPSRWVTTQAHCWSINSSKLLGWRIRRRKGFEWSSLDISMNVHSTHWVDQTVCFLIISYKICYESKSAVLHYFMARSKHSVSSLWLIIFHDASNSIS